MNKKPDESTLEASLEAAELMADLSGVADVIAEVPVVGTAVKILKAKDSIRDRVFAAKILKFLTSLDRVSDKDRAKFKNKIKDAPDEATRVGETLLLVLDRVTDLQKPIVLGSLFISYLDGVITSSDLRRMAQAVDMAFADDLEELLSRQDLPDKSLEAWVQSLSFAGLADLVGGETYGDVGKIYFTVNRLGRNLRKAYFYGRQLRS